MPESDKRHCCESAGSYTRLTGGQLLGTPQGRFTTSNERLFTLIIERGVEDGKAIDRLSTAATKVSDTNVIYSAYYYYVNRPISIDM